MGSSCTDEGTLIGSIWGLSRFDHQTFIPKPAANAAKRPVSCLPSFHQGINSAVPISTGRCLPVAFLAWLAFVLGMARNVLGKPLATCSSDPMTGFFRDGCCNTNSEDRGMHTICVEVTNTFLTFSKNVGNNLSTPAPQYGFPGLKEGDRWCLCLRRWVEAQQFGCAPLVVLEATHASVCEFVDLETLQEHAVR